MATYDSYLVNGTPGTNEYSSFASWWSAVQGRGTDLTSRADIERITVNFSGSYDETVSLTGVTMSSTYYAEVTVASAYRHDGTPQSGFYMSGNSGGNTTRYFVLEGDGARISYMDCENTRGAGAGSHCLRLVGQDAIANACIAKAVNTYGFEGYCSSTSLSVFPRFYNCLGYNSGIYGFASNDSARQRWKAYNCVAAGNTTEGFRGDGSTNAGGVYNCAAYNNGTGFGTTWDSSSDYNMSDDDSEPGSNSPTTNIVSGDFNAAASNDFHLSGASSNLYQAGADWSSLYTTDIDGDTWAATYSIGFDQISTSIEALTCSPGSWSFTGTSVTLAYGPEIVCTPGSWAFTGTSVDLLYGPEIVATPGSWSFNGTDAVLLYGPELILDPGSWAFNGTDADLIYGRVLTLTEGSWAFNGTDLTFDVGRYLELTPGSWAFNGTDLDFAVGRYLELTPGTWAFNGTDVTLSAGAKTLTCEPGTWAFTGTDVTLSKFDGIVLEITTTGAAETVVIPGTGTGYDWTISWGDGSSAEKGTSNAPSHEFASANTYQVRIGGTFPRIYYANGAYCSQLTGILAWGTENTWSTNQSGAFQQCTNLVGTIPDDSQGPFDTLVTAYYMFLNTGIEGPLPAAMVCPDLEIAYEMFHDCASLDGAYPSGMVLDNLTDGIRMFSGAALTGSLPSAMVLGNLNTANGMFFGCSLSGSWPSSMTLASITDGGAMFRGNSGLTGALPAGMTMPLLQDADYMFYNTGLTALAAGTVLANLTIASFMFFGTSLASLPGTLTLASLATANGMFRDVATLSGDKPSGLVLGSLTNGATMFDGTGISSTFYSQLLVAMEANNSNNGVSFGAADTQYLSSASAARAALIADHSWSIDDAGLADRTITCTPGVWAFTGTDVDLLASHEALSLTPGSWAFTGTDVDLGPPGRAIVALPGTWAFTGTDVDLIYTSLQAYTLTVLEGSWRVRGTDVDLIWSGEPVEVRRSKLYYEPSPPAYGIDVRTSSWVRRELMRIAQVTQQDNIVPLHFKEPQATDGMKVLADGVHWDPGYGVGEYTYIGGQWVPAAVLQTYWDDQKTPAIQLKLGATSKPDYDYSVLALMMPQNDPTEIAYSSDQLTHKVATGTRVFYPHFHYLQDEASVPTFKLDFRFYNNGEAADGSFTTISTDDGDGPVFTYTSGQILQILPLPPIVVLDVKPSMYYDMRIYRDDNLVTGDVPLKSFDFHIELDAIGSRGQYTK